MSLRTFYNDFIEALGRKTGHIEIKMHPQPDGGAVLEAIIIDPEGQKSIQELHVSPSDRKKFGDTFLIEGFKAEVRAASTSRLRRNAS